MKCDHPAPDLIHPSTANNATSIYLQAVLLPKPGRKVGRVRLARCASLAEGASAARVPLGAVVVVAGSKRLSSSTNNDRRSSRLPHNLLQSLVSTDPDGRRPILSPDLPLPATPIITQSTSATPPALPSRPSRTAVSLVGCDVAIPVFAHALAPTHLASALLPPQPSPILPTRDLSPKHHPLATNTAWRLRGHAWADGIWSRVWRREEESVARAGRDVGSRRAMHRPPAW